MATPPTIDLKDWAARKGLTLSTGPAPWRKEPTVGAPPLADDLPADAKVDPQQVVEDALRAARLAMKRLADAQSKGADVLDDLAKVGKTVESLVKSRGELLDRSKRAAKELNFEGRAAKLVEWYEGLPSVQATQVDGMIEAVKAKRGRR